MILHDFMMDLREASIESRNIYKAIGDILSKIVENFDLLEKYKTQRIIQTFLAGIESEYANEGLFTRIKIATIELARAYLKLGFHKTYLC